MQNKMEEEFDCQKGRRTKEATTIRKWICQLQPTLELFTDIKKLKSLCPYPESCPYGWWKCETSEEKVRRVEMVRQSNPKERTHLREERDHKLYFE
jgi:hypothetical protein